MQILVSLDDLSPCFLHAATDGYFSFGPKRLDWYML